MGGALCPIFMGWIADQYSMAIGFVVPLICFVVVAFYGLIGHRFGDA
jgi:FHS family L-fucose permease-like MFS transporter